ncbi:MAG TPA: hypothetical protein VEE84_03310, partial [Burkholderiaceae bacterium]|nr:hypothetical protein [Burkholderiaceae bacterium]
MTALARGAVATSSRALGRHLPQAMARCSDNFMMQSEHNFKFVARWYATRCDGQPLGFEAVQAGCRTFA